MNNQLLQFIAMMTIGIAIPMVITNNKGFNLLEQKPCGVHDVVLDALEPVSEYLQGNQLILNSLITASSLLLDIQYILTLFAIASRGRIRHTAPFVLMYALRFIMQRLCYLPFPGKSAWLNPGMPTLVVFYEEVGDFFPSGHVAFPLLAALYHNRLNQRRTSLFALY